MVDNQRKFLLFLFFNLVLEAILKYPLIIKTFFN